MNFTPFPEIKTERLLLRPLKTSDWQEISFLRSDEQVNKFVDRPKAETKEEAIHFIDKITKDISNNEWIYWAISLKSNSTLIGSICLWKFSEDKKTAEVGFDLHPNFQKKGIMDEALKSVIQFGFNNLHLDKIEAYTQYNNASSLQLLEKNHFNTVENKKDANNPHNLILELHNSLINT